MSIHYPTLSAAADLAHFSHFRHSFNYNIFPDTLFMQNKPNFKRSQMNINSFMTGEYEKMDNWLLGKTKPKQTQLKPVLSLCPRCAVEWAKTNPIQSQFKLNCYSGGRIKFHLFFFLNLMVGYADKNVWKFCSNFVMSCKTKNMDLLFIRKEGD